MNNEVKREGFESFADFYPYYLAEHSNVNCRRLHFIGSACVLAVIVVSIMSRNAMWLWWLPVIGYGFAWVGHFVFEKNKPATFKYPGWSLMGDWVMFKDIVMGRVKI